MQLPLECANSFTHHTTFRIFRQKSQFFVFLWIKKYLRNYLLFGKLKYRSIVEIIFLCVQCDVMVRATRW